MKLLVISKYNKKEKNAGAKAKVDIERILYRRKNCKIKTFYEPANCSKLFRMISAVFQIVCLKVMNYHICIFQFPFSSKVIDASHADINIGIIHDINGLRYQDMNLEHKEIAAIDRFDYIVAHNEIMASYLTEKKIDAKKIYTIDIFDYLVYRDINRTIDSHSIPIIIYPGNLAKTKSPFLYQLDQDRMDFYIYAYGVGITDNINDKIIYKGTFQPDNLESIQGDVGLIWDGSWDSSDENKSFKNYTKYNNPHKFSCCIACGLPVIVWKRAAIAEFVEQNNVGYTIDNLYEINEINWDDYDKKKENAINIGKKLKKGFYTERVIDCILEDLSCNRKTNTKHVNT